MKALIAINPQPINNKPIPTVSARELHKFMEVQTLFKDWIARRIEDFEYQEGRDFIAITGCSNLSNGEFNPNPPKEYHLTLDMAKELAMIERNPMGRVARKYFIRCEMAAMETIPVLRQALLERNPLWNDIRRYHLMGLRQFEVAKLVERSTSTVRVHSKRMRELGLLEPLGRSHTGAWERSGVAERQLPLFTEVAQ